MANLDFTLSEDEAREFGNSIETDALRGFKQAVKFNQQRLALQYLDRILEVITKSITTEPVTAAPTKRSPNTKETSVSAES